MQHAMEEMGKKPTPEEMEKFMQEVDLDGNGTVGTTRADKTRTQQRTQQRTLAITHAC